jgi:hypothetical protein
MCEPTIACTTDEYRTSLIQLWNAADEKTTTVEQIDNGLKCLSIMLFGLDESDPLIRYENQIMLEMVSVRVVRFKIGCISN